MPVLKFKGSSRPERSVAEEGKAQARIFIREALAMQVYLRSGHLGMEILLDWFRPSVLEV